MSHQPCCTADVAKTLFVLVGADAEANIDQLSSPLWEATAQLLPSCDMDILGLERAVDVHTHMSNLS